jgi:hypothetical protein
VLAFVLGACVLARALSAALGHVAAHLDAWSFRETAAQLASGDLHAYNGARGPVFPLLLVASGGSDRALFAVHSAIGCVVAVVLSYVTLTETRSRLAASCAGCMVGLGFYTLAFESSVMSECLVSLWLVAALATARTLLSGEASTPRMVALGLFVGLAILTRPMFLYLVPVFAWALRRSAARPLISFAATSVGMVVAWSLVNFVVVGSFGPTTLLGFNLTNHTGAFIERAPAEFADIRDVYLPFRAVRIAEYGNHHQTIWDALPTLEKTTGQSFAMLSRRCAKMSMALIVACPGRYLASVADAAGRFMLAPNCRGGPWLPPHGPLLAAVWDLQEAAFIGAKVALVALAPFAYRRVSPVVRLMIAVVVVGALFQALLEVGENDRYSVPLQPWAASAAFALGWSLTAKWRTSAAPR